MLPEARTPSCSQDAAWYVHVTLEDVEVAAAEDGTSTACEVLGVPVARIAYRDLRAICAKLAVVGYKNKRKSDMARMIADKKQAAAWSASPSEDAVPSRDLARWPVTSAANKINQLCREYPRVMAGTATYPFLNTNGRDNGGDSRGNPVAALCKRPPRVGLRRVTNSVGGSPYVAVTSTQYRSHVPPQRVDFGCQQSTESPQAVRQLDVYDESCSTSGSNSANTEDIRFVTPSSQDSSSTQDPMTPKHAVFRVSSDESASLAAWFKVSDRITALRASLKAEGDQELAGELKDDIAFLVRKKRRITMVL